MKETVDNKGKATLHTGQGGIRARRTRRWPTLLLGVSVLGAVAVQGAVVIQEFYLPLPEEQIYTVLNKHVPFSPPDVEMISIFSIVVTTPNTQITYDQWESGYEADINNPTIAWDETTNPGGTQVWGDGDDLNGICPGFVNDPSGLAAGTAITLRSPDSIPIPRDSAEVFFDAGDRIGSTKAITITRASGESYQRRESHAVVVEVLSTLDHGLSYIAPVGTNVSANGMFRNVDLMVMADEDATTVQVDPDGPGPAPTTTTNINRGMSGAFLVEDISKGATIVADKPVQAHMIAGQFVGQFETRSFVLRPVDFWSNKYIIPVGTMDTNYPGLVHVFNSGSSPITVNYTDRTGAGSFVVPGDNGLAVHSLPFESGTLLESADGSPFFPICTMDTGLNMLSGGDFDWGFAPIAFEGLTTEAVAGWAPGSVTSAEYGTGIENGSPVWISAISNTTLYVDFGGDRQGPLTDPSGGKYDTNFVVNALDAQVIYDPSTNQQTGVRIYTLDETVIAGVWGEDPSVAESGSPYMDMGYALVPFPVVSIIKTAEMVPELDTEPLGVLNVGDTVEYTLRINNRGTLPLGNLLVLDSFAEQLTYIENTTYFNGNLVADDDPFFGGTPFPLDKFSGTDPFTFLPLPPGKTVTNLVRGGEVKFIYRARIKLPGPILNIGSAEEGPVDVTSTNVITAVSTISIGDAAVLEGDNGITNLVFPVTLSNDRNKDTRVDYIVSNGTAVNGTDYTTAATGSVTIPQGATNGVIEVPVTGDLEVEPDETLFVTLQTNETFVATETNEVAIIVTYLVIADGEGAGTIINDDSELIHDLVWVYNPRRDSWYGTLTLSNHELSAESMTTSVWYEVKSNAAHRLRFPTGPDPETGPSWYYLDVSSNFTAAVTNIGNGDHLLDPGESMVCCTIEDKTIELWGRGAITTNNFEDLVKADWFTPPAQPLPDEEPLADWDGDGVSNAEEEIAGTNPLDRESVFMIQVEPMGNNNKLFWNGQEGRFYTILSSPSLTVPFSVLASDIAGVEPVTVYIDTNVTSSGQTFYKGEVQLK